MTRLDTAVTTLLANLNRTSENFNALMDKDNQLSIKNTLTDIETLSHTLAARSATIDSSLANAARTMEGTARLTNELPLLAQRVQRSADAFDHMANELSHAGAGVSSTLNSTQQFTNETLPEAHQLVIELRDLTGSLQHFSDDLDKNPSMLLYGKTSAPRGPGE
jgi:phospholipid/cholesterol/gamma-HCH transport system substrate-binding protein